MSDAIIGLIGVVIGGLLTFFVQYFIEGRREARSVRAAARLLREELEGTRLYAQFVLGHNEWWTHGEGFPDEIWLEQRSLLASAPSSSDWLAVARGYRQVNSIRNDYRRAHKDWNTLGYSPTLERDDREGLEIKVNVLEDALETLAALADKSFPMTRQLLRRASVIQRTD